MLQFRDFFYHLIIFYLHILLNRKPSVVNQPSRPPPPEQTINFNYWNKPLLPPRQPNYNFGPNFKRLYVPTGRYQNDNVCKPNTFKSNFQPHVEKMETSSVYGMPLGPNNFRPQQLQELMTYESQNSYYDQYENNYFDYDYNYEDYDHNNYLDETYEIKY